MNIYQKLVEVRKAVPYLQKENKGYQFNYVSSSQVLASLKLKMDELNLLLIPHITDHKVSTETVEWTEKDKPKKQTTYFTELNVVFLWVNADNPEEKIECPWYGQGIDTAGEKGVGKALTYAEKYMMLKFFNIPTDKDDPDSFQDKNAPSPTKGTPTPTNGETDVITEAQAKRLFAIAKGDKEAVKAVISQFKYGSTTAIKKSDYNQICDKIQEKINPPPIGDNDLPWSS